MGECGRIERVCYNSIERVCYAIIVCMCDVLGSILCMWCIRVYIGMNIVPAADRKLGPLVLVVPPPPPVEKSSVYRERGG